jgi:hypothetical protein
MLGAVYDVADVMQPCRAHCKVNVLVIPPESLKNLGGPSCYKPYMGKAVLGVVQRLHGLVLLAYIYIYIVILSEPVEEGEAFFIIKGSIHVMPPLQQIFCSFYQNKPRRTIDKIALKEDDFLEAGYKKSPEAEPPGRGEIERKQYA